MQPGDPIPLGAYDDEDTAIVFESPFGGPEDGRFLRNVVIPTLTPYLPEEGARTGTGVIVAPGGALHFLAIDNEGAWVAERLAERGIAAFVLHYRVATTPVPLEEFSAIVQLAFLDPEFLGDISLVRRAPALADGSAAVRHVRENAEAWGLNPERIGMVGFSAGGYVSLVTTLDAPPTERPSFVAPIYPGYWGDIVVPTPAPPMFLAWATDDGLGDVIVGPALTFYDAWRRAGASVEAHAFSGGGHGFGMRPRGTTSDRWFETFLAWLAASGF